MSKWNSDFQAWEPDGINSAAESELLLKHTAGTANTRDKPGITASTLFHSELAEREFSSHVFRVPDVLQWAGAQGLTVDTEPDIRAFEFVQAEALLAAIERKVGNAVTPEQALELVASNPELSRHQLASKPISARWLLGAEAHRQWRHLLGQAIENGELRLLDFASKLPIAAKTTAAPPDTQAVALEPKAAPEWQELARNRAREIIKEYTARDLFLPQVRIAELIAEEFRRDGVMGADGKPLAGTYIKRHAMKGISSAQGRQLSTAPRRGK